MVLKLAGWRSKRYPLALFAGRQKVWEGMTPATLGYVHLPIQQPVSATTLTIRMLAPVGDSSAFGSVTELAGGQANAMDQVESSKSKTDLNIIEAEFHAAP